MFLKHLMAAAFAVSVGTSAAQASPESWRHEWPDTNFETTTIENWAEIMSGGPPKDGIPAITGPNFHAVAEETQIGGREPVITVEFEGEVPRAYPLRYLTWHEIVNDVIGGRPVAVTFCPLCNSAMVFDRRVDGVVLEFGVSGKLRNSDMVMFDRQTESWWQQAIGTGIVGRYTGMELLQVPSWLESFDEFKARNPEGVVMTEPEFRRAYGRNPYVNYDSSTRPFLYSGELPPHGINPMMRVIRVGTRAWPMDRLSAEGLVSEAGVTLAWVSGQASALDARSIAKGRDVGSVRVRDAAGNDLPHDVMFAFAYHAFFPEGEWMLGQ